MLSEQKNNYCEQQELGQEDRKRIFEYFGCFWPDQAVYGRNRRT